MSVPVDLLLAMTDDQHQPPPPQLCIRDFDRLHVTVPTDQCHHVDGDYATQICAATSPNHRLSLHTATADDDGDDNMSFTFQPTMATTASNCLVLTNTASLPPGGVPPAGESFILQSDIHYFVVDHFYGSSSGGGSAGGLVVSGGMATTANGNDC
jgi:hypothetical protein